MERAKITGKEILPTPIPYSLNKDAVKNGRQIEEAFKKAEFVGILKTEYMDNPSTGERELTSCILKKPVLEKNNAMEFLTDLKCAGETAERDDKIFEKEYLEAIEKKYFIEDGGAAVSISMIMAWAEKLKALKESIVHGNFEPYSIVHNKMESNALDNVIHSPEMTRILLETVELYETVDQGLERVYKIIEKIDGKNSMNQFCDALFTGILEYSINMISFYSIEMHAEKKVILASENMPYGKYLMYQAYVSFQELEESMRDNIIELTRAKIENLEEGDDKIALKIKEEYTLGYMKELEAMYGGEKNKEEMKVFYDEFCDLLFEYVDQFV